jgi:DNA-directed RNA polymerase specialized sigma24 family protein
MPINPGSLNTGEEQRLLAAAGAGDELAFGRLAASYRPGLECFCLLMLGCPHAAHDAVSETLLRGWRDVGRVAPSGCARIWLYRLAMHVCLEDLDEADESGCRGSFDGVRDTDERSP